MSEIEVIQESIKDEVSHIESESRMILPGIQALFGFQLIAVFNDRFENLPLEFQLTHWFAISCTAIATIFVLSPAAYHRLAEPHSISRRFTQWSNKLMVMALIPLMLGCVTDFFLIGYMITKNMLVSAVVSAILLAVFLFNWFIVPLSMRNKRVR